MLSSRPSTRATTSRMSFGWLTWYPPVSSNMAIWKSLTYKTINQGLDGKINWNGRCSLPGLIAGGYLKWRHNVPDKKSLEHWPWPCIDLDILDTMQKIDVWLIRIPGWWRPDGNVGNVHMTFAAELDPLLICPAMMSSFCSCCCVWDLV